MVNPFKFGKEVSGYQFYDRHDVCEKLYRILKSGTSNVVLYAPRRYGKTSLVLKVLERFNLESIPSIYFDVSRSTSLERFCEEYASAACAVAGHAKAMVNKIATYLAHLHPSFSFEGPVPTVKFDYGARMTQASLAEVLDLPEKIAADLGNKTLIVALDEFQEVAGLSSEFVLEKIFRSCVQMHRNVRYVFFGSKTHMLKRMFGSHSKPFYNSALPMRLDKPPREESAEFVRSRFSDAGIGISSEAVDKVVAASENIPYYLQAVASMTFDAVERAGAKTVRDDDIASAIAFLLDANADLYEERLRNLSPSQRDILLALAREPAGRFDSDYRAKHGLPVSSTLHSALKHLVDEGLVETNQSGYQVGDPFFARFLLTSPARVFA